MDITTLGNNSIKIKGKQVAFIVDPTKEMPKTSSDAIILLNGANGMDISRATDYRIVLDGPGGYEVGGAKISGTKTPKGTFYKLSIDGVSVFLGPTVDAKIEGFSECQVAIINTNSEFNESFVTTLEPKIAVLYGEKIAESAKKLGIETAVPVSKITILKDKFPEKMEIAVLG